MGLTEKRKPRKIQRGADIGEMDIEMYGTSRTEVMMPLLIRILAG